ncbi:MAG TPA: hypothetical protein VHX88_00170 [Solirubrobacteraceae bacterium]|nr:hypothetical protein [Solirubrobacteraceae bacterium]
MGFGAATPADAHAPAPAPIAQPIKLRAVEAALALEGVDSIADLGGVWAVDGVYTFHALEHATLRRAVLVDDDITAAVHERAGAHPQLELIEADFGSPEVADQVGEIGAVLLFDVLLHQVDPDWSEILERYARRARAVAIVQPQYLAAEQTTRLIELGRERYLAQVPKQAEHDALFDRLDELNPRRGRRWRDVHDVWQWGIVDEDLRTRMRALGFCEVHFEDGGQWRGLEAFAARAFVFAR